MKIARLVSIDGKFYEEKFTGTETYTAEGNPHLRFTFKPTGKEVSLDELLQLPSKNFVQEKPSDDPETMAIHHGERRNADYIMYEFRGSILMGFSCEAQYFMKK